MLKKNKASVSPKQIKNNSMLMVKLQLYSSTFSLQKAQRINKTFVTMTYGFEKKKNVNKSIHTGSIINVSCRSNEEEKNRSEKKH